MFSRHTGHIGKFKAFIIILIFIFSMGYGISSLVATANASSPTNSINSPINSINYTAIKNNISQTLAPDNDSAWYATKIDMIIIAPNDFVSTLVPLVQWNDQKGVFTKIANISEINMTYPGRDLAERIRNCIKEYYMDYNIKWVLLAGATDIIPTRYVWNPDVSIIDSQGGNVEEADGGIDYKPTDQYYADLNGTWDTNNNGIYGESLQYAKQDEISWTPNVYVGRFPAETVQQLSDMVNKTINYEKNPLVGPWMNNILLGASIQDLASTSDSDGELEYFLAQKIIDESITPNMNYTLLTGLYTQYNLTESSFDYYANQGNSIVFFAGHGAPNAYAGYNIAENGYLENYFTGNDASHMTNNGMPSLFYADACSTNFFDHGYNNNYYLGCIGTDLIEDPTGGAIGYIGAMRVTWYYENDSYVLTNGENDSLCELNRGMSRIFFQQMFQDGYYQQGEALYKMKQAYVNSNWLKYNPLNDAKDSSGQKVPYNIHYTEWERKNVLTYNLLGDPEVDIYTNLPSSFSSNIISNSEHYYGGQELNLIVRDSSYHVVPNATLCIQGSDGAYMSFTSNIAGQINVRLPATAQNFNYTLSAHNMLVYQGSFNTSKDATPPIFDSKCSFPDGTPSTDHVTIACINATDLQTAVSAGYFVFSSNNFKNYSIVPMYRVNDTNMYAGTIPKMTTGDFSYIIYIFDYSGNANWTTVNTNDSFNIKLPPIAIFVIGINSIIIIGLAVFIYSKKSTNRKYSRYLELIGISPPLEQNTDSDIDSKI